LRHHARPPKLADFGAFGISEFHVRDGQLVIFPFFTKFV
jgi:hypothetical protein